VNPTGKSFPGKASTRFPHGFRRAPRSCRRRRAAADRRAAFVAELAAAAGRDPKDFLVEVSGTPRVVSPQMLGDTWNHGESAERYPVDTGRLRRVVAELAAREAGWRRTRVPDQPQDCNGARPHDSACVAHACRSSGSVMGRCAVNRAGHSARYGGRITSAVERTP